MASAGALDLDLKKTWIFWGSTTEENRITLWLFNMAMENGPFIDDLPIKNGDFS